MTIADVLEAGVSLKAAALFRLLYEGGAKTFDEISEMAAENGEHSIRSGLRELRDAELIKKRQRRDKGTFQGVEYAPFGDFPDTENPDTDNPVSGKPRHGSSSTVSGASADNDRMEKTPTRENPDTENPETVGDSKKVSPSPKDNNQTPTHVQKSPPKSSSNDDDKQPPEKSDSEDAIGDLTGYLENVLKTYDLPHDFGTLSKLTMRIEQSDLDKSEYRDFISAQAAKLEVRIDEGKVPERRFCSYFASPKSIQWYREDQTSDSPSNGGGQSRDGGYGTTVGRNDYETRNGESVESNDGIGDPFEGASDVEVIEYSIALREDPESYRSGILEGVDLSDVDPDLSDLKLIKNCLHIGINPERIKPELKDHYNLGKYKEKYG